MSHLKILLIPVLLLAACAPGGGAAAAGAPDPANATYKIDRETVTLANGRAEREAAPGSATKVVTTLTNQKTTGDVDGDGRADAVAVLTYQPGGSGTFFYLAALLNTASGVTATPGALLGDRVVVTALRLDGRIVAVDLLERPAGQPLSASPMVAVTKRFAVKGGALVAQ